MATITCQNCGIQRDGVRATTKYCSDLCRVAASRGTAPKKSGVKSVSIEGMRIPAMQNPNGDKSGWNPVPPEGCRCGYVWTIRGTHISTCQLYERPAPDFENFNAAINEDGEIVKLDDSIEGFDYNGDPHGLPEKFSVGRAIPEIPPRVALTREELISKMNNHLEAKGMPPIQSELPPTEFVRTGFSEIDGLTSKSDALGWGGLPRKHITEIFGTKAAGKTSLMKQIVHFNTFNEETGPLSVLYVDVENGLVNPPPNIVLTNNPLIDEVEEMVCKAIDDDDYDLIVIDSVAMLSTRQLKEGDREAMMAKPKAMSRFVQRLNAFLRVAESEHRDDPHYIGTAVVFINQLRDTGNSFGVREFTPGGRALEYGASLRLELRSAKADKISRQGVSVGQKVRVKVEKSRFNGEDVGTTVMFSLMFSEL